MGYGGPTALAEHMQRNLVTENQWFTPEDFKEAFVFSQLSPGPLATQLAMYLGWMKAGLKGAALSAVFLIAPSFLMILGLAALYISFGNIHFIQSLFYGVGASIIAIIARSVINLSRKSLQKTAVLWILCFASAVYTLATGSQSVWLFLASGIIALLFELTKTKFTLSLSPIFLYSGIQGEASLKTLASVFFYFLKIGTIVFGSGLAIIPFMHGGVVSEHRWLTEQQFLDAIAMGMITPGPVLVTSAFIGCLIAGVAGGLCAALGVFLPALILVIVLAPHFRKFSYHPGMKTCISGVIAAAIGGIAGATVILGKHSIIDLPTGAIALISFGLLMKFKKIPEPLLILAAGLAGILFKS